MRALRPFIYFFCVVLFLLILPASVLINGSGAPAKRTGAPGDGDGTPGNNGSCADAGCHNSFAVNSGPGDVTLDAPTEFIAGVPVEFLVSVHDTTRFRFGFQVTIKNGAAENVGTFELIDGNTRFSTGNENYVTHTLASSVSEWMVKWTPPNDITEDVIIYVAGNAADNRFTAANDYVYETSANLPISTIAGVDDEPETVALRSIAVFPNPSSDRVTVNYDLALSSTATILLYDTTGRRIRSTTTMWKGAGSHQETFVVSDLPSGVYFCVIETEYGSTGKPISVIRNRR